MSDAATGFVKLWAGWRSDRSRAGRSSLRDTRSPGWLRIIRVGRSLVDGAGEPHDRVGRSRPPDSRPGCDPGRQCAGGGVWPGIRLPPRHGRAGAVLGPALALVLLPLIGYRSLFAVTLLPGLLAGRGAPRARSAPSAGYHNMDRAGAWAPGTVLEIRRRSRSVRPRQLRAQPPDPAQPPRSSVRAWGWSQPPRRPCSSTRYTTPSTPWRPTRSASSETACPRQLWRSPQATACSVS